LNWVCNEDWKPPFAQSCFFIGSMIGVPIFGWLADYFGRIPIIVTTNLVGGVFGLASSFCNSFLLFCILRFIVGLAHDSSFYIIYILGLEYVSASYRSIVANVPILLFLTASMCTMPWIAYGIGDWTWFGVAIHVPFLLTVFTP
ncbi:Solute carrier family 22 member 21, partial [Armadillidium nasatum]